MRILILSVGTRCKLVEYFKNHNSGFDKVIVTDCNRYAPAIYKADKYYIVSRMTEPNYVNDIIEICIKEKINIVLPLQEDELLLMAKNKVKFSNKGFLLAVSDYKSIVLCRDKYEMYRFLCDNKIPTVETVLSGEVERILPTMQEVFVKPRNGSGSIGNMRVNSKELLKALVNSCEDALIIQPYIEGKEYGIDVFVDWISGEIISMFCKEKIRMRAGETEKSISVINEKIENLVKNVLSKINLRGAIDMDILESKGEFYILEINPRFGGGYPHAYECGVDFTKMLSVNASGVPNYISTSKYDEGVLALKYSEIEII